jgi:hypothetical protein
MNWIPVFTGMTKRRDCHPACPSIRRGSPAGQALPERRLAMTGSKGSLAPVAFRGKKELVMTDRRSNR